MVIPPSQLGIKLPDEECVRLALNEDRLNPGWAMPVANDIITALQNAFTTYTNNRGADLSELLHRVPQEMDLFIRLGKQYGDHAAASRSLAQNALDNDQMLVEKCQSAVSSLQSTMDQLSANIEGDKEAMQQAEEQVTHTKQVIGDVVNQIQAEEKRHDIEAAFAWTGIGALVLAADHALSAIIGKKKMLEQELSIQESHAKAAQAAEEKVKQEWSAAQSKLNDANEQLKDEEGRKQALEEQIARMEHQVATSDALGSALLQLSAIMSSINENIDSIRTAESFLTSEVEVVSPTAKKSVGVDFKVAFLALATAYDKDQEESFVLGNSFGEALNV
ncbi:hypothetical protein BWQ96_02235 [Gracilariopsis chorda]|uniref:Uncharacterized protein n=1 Tax=Gracilariopsis chorda TaxID=448386 RepID=A0A2V3J0Y2_9FLOR|nr:hypothetical protein BWQ96_02235 [Gracilariopsis chorda]|eukprot:PXF48044.1 hypothetical protein BWQ96_02235 [Gracilariopsis chorda]